MRASLREALERTTWEGLSLADRTAIAREVVGLLPPGFRFVEVGTYELGAVRSSVATYELDGRSFALLPGCELELGLAHFEASDAQRASWEEVVAEYGMPEDPLEYLREVCTRTRRVRIRPLLVEREPHEIGLVAAGLDHPLVQKNQRLRGALEDAIAEVSRGVHKGVEVYRALKVLKTADGQVQSFIVVPTTRTELVAELDAQGFRLLTSDEWEYACGAGARTLFRWGDECPYDVDPHHGRGREGPHARLNAFGLRIAYDPYAWEIVAEPELVRGGDGGHAICGGISEFYGWLSLATSYVVDSTSDAWMGMFTEGEGVTGYWARRARSIDLGDTAT